MMKSKKADASATARKTETLTLEKRYMEEKDGKMVFSPDSDRKRASYEHYEFDLKEYREHIKTLPLTVEVEIISVTNELYTPRDPRSQRPDGGFRLTFKKCRILKTLDSQ